MTKMTYKGTMVRSPATIGFPGTNPTWLCTSSLQGGFSCKYSTCSYFDFWFPREDLLVPLSGGPGFLNSSQTFDDGACTFHPDIKPWEKGVSGLPGPAGPCCVPTYLHQVAPFAGFLTGCWVLSLPALQQQSGNPESLG